MAALAAVELVADKTPHFKRKLERLGLEAVAVELAPGTCLAALALAAL
tara:strand:+ start:669 stop:812 length:144 start_codon:yes stop_codon:yes gene_type:complete